MPLIGTHNVSEEHTNSWWQIILIFDYFLKFYEEESVFDKN